VANYIKGLFRFPGSEYGEAPGFLEDTLLLGQGKDHPQSVATGIPAEKPMYDLKTEQVVIYFFYISSIPMLPLVTVNVIHSYFTSTT
jgi:hypothetical protein